MKAINTSALEASEMVVLPPNFVMISINEEHSPPVPLSFSATDRVLRVHFTDITADEKDKGVTYRPIQDQDAHAIIKFVKEHKDKNFIVHCAAGVSRSSAVCFYIHTIYGHELRKSFWFLSEPNPFVLGKLLIEHHRPIIQQ